MTVIYEDNHLIAIHKPAGLLTHSDKTGDQCATEQVKLFLKKKYNKPGDVFLNPVHRLDRPVSGLLLFAKTSKATTRMTRLFAQKETKKTYLAISDKQPKEPLKTITHFLLKNSRTNTTKAVQEGKPNAKKAILSYKLIAELKSRFLIQVNPKTGRSHQIRVQLSSINCPIIGDLKYGSKQKTDGRSIALHSYQLAFIHPVKKEPITITCPPPKNEIWKAFSKYP